MTVQASPPSTDPVPSPSSNNLTDLIVLSTAIKIEVFAPFLPELPSDFFLGAFAPPLGAFASPHGPTGNYGQGVGAQGGYGPLLMASIDRVQADLLKPECAKDFKNVKNTINKAGKVDFKDMGTPKVDKDLNPTKDSPAAASYNSVTGAIRLNSQINWIDPDDTPALQGKKSVSLTL